MHEVKPDRNSQGVFSQGNRAAITHGVHAFLATGSLPPKATYIRRNLGRFKVCLETAVRDKFTTISLYRAALIQSVIRHEARACLLQRWLRHGDATLSHSDKVSTLKEIGAATDARDRALKALGLDDADSQRSILDELYGPRGPRAHELPAEGGNDG